jgi:hypothetical protein
MANPVSNAGDVFGVMAWGKVLELRLLGLALLD